MLPEVKVYSQHCSGILSASSSMNYITIGFALYIEFCSVIAISTCSYMGIMYCIGQLMMAVTYRYLR